MDDLIEQLGGYEKAQKTLGKMKATNEFHKSSKMCGFFYTENSINELRDSLLQYRREHNIFEVGDKVVFVSEKMDFLDDNKVHTISMITENNLLKVCGLYVGFDAVKHATPEEIQAGCRL